MRGEMREDSQSLGQWEKECESGGSGVTDEWLANEQAAQVSRRTS